MFDNFNSKKNNSGKSRLMFLLIFAVCSSILTLNSYTLSKYVYKSEIAEIVEAENFYFTSSYLTSSASENLVYTDTVSFTIANNDGLNKTNLDIEYDLSFNIEKNEGLVLTDSDDTVYDLDMIYNNQILRGGVNSVKSFTLTGKPKDKITITASSTFPYARTISATFEFVYNEYDSYYTVTNRDDYVEVDLFIGSDMPNTVDISYGDALIPDRTNDLMREWKPSDQSGRITVYEPFVPITDSSSPDNMYNRMPYFGHTNGNSPSVVYQLVHNKNEAYDGNSCLRINYLSEIVNQNYRSINQYVEVEPGETYEYGLAYKTSYVGDTGKVWFALTEFAESGNSLDDKRHTLSLKGFADKAARWRTASYSYTIPSEGVNYIYYNEDKSKARVTFQIMTEGPLEIYIDNLFVRKKGTTENLLKNWGFEASTLEKNSHYKLHFFKSSDRVYNNKGITEISNEEECVIDIN